MAGKVRIGLIGCGWHGRGNLSPALAGMGNVDLIACADVNEVAAHQTSKDFGFDRSYLDYHEMLSREDLDGVVVATPHHLLRDAVIASVHAGNNVFVEKPMALNKKQGEEIRDAAHKAGVTVMVGFCVRYAEPRRIMKSLLDRGAVGDIVQVSAIKGGGNHTPPDWMGDPKTGGGALYWLGSHITDQVLWMVGSEPERVSAEIVWNSVSGADQHSAYIIRFKNGVLANVLVWLLSRNPGGQMDFIEVLGTAGRIKAGTYSNVIEVHSEVLPEYSHPTTIRLESLRTAEMFQDQFKAWVGALVEKAEPPTTVEDGINMLEVLDAVYESGKTGMPVTFG